ncbi:MAG: putative ABC transporter permease [Ruminococcus sp.]|jgi:uncharacterized membrane protein|nr:putative ABC transporter permease [Ruminococcus sp.]
MKLYKFFKMLSLFVYGGSIFCLIELIFTTLFFDNTFTHIVSYFQGGVIFLILGMINNWFSWELGLVWQCLLGSVFITAIELVTGLFFNVWLGLHIWDYSGMPLSFMGQICLEFSLYWVFVSALGIILDDFLRYTLFKEQKPKYKIINLKNL